MLPTTLHKYRAYNTLDVMNTTFVKLSRPLLVRVEMTGNRYIYKTYYGFEISPEFKKDNDSIRNYVGYLASVSDWSNGGLKDYDIKFDLKCGEMVLPIGIDRQGYRYNDWKKKVEEQSIRKFNLSFSVKTIYITREMYDKSVDNNGFIISEELFDDLNNVRREPIYDPHDDLPF